MNVQIQKINSENKHHVNQFDRKFTVKEKLTLSLENGNLTYSIVSVTPYEKEIPIEDVEDLTAFIDNDEKIIFLAFVNDQPAGQIKMIKWWNEYAYVDDLIIAPQYRGRGVGKSLIAEAVRWSREKRFPGIMLETQDDNVAACKLYQACGFVLGGFDAYTFKNIKPNEIALFWYLLF
jgi:streptothricin acetyltransferase